MKLTLHTNPIGLQHVENVIAQLVNFPEKAEISKDMYLSLFVITGQIADLLKKEKLLVLDNPLKAAVQGELIAPTRSMAKWSATEEEQLLKEFKAGNSIVVIAGLHQRTNGGIIGRLEKFLLAGKIKGEPCQTVTDAVTQRKPVHLNEDALTFFFDLCHVRKNKYEYNRDLTIWIP